MLLVHFPLNSTTENKGLLNYPVSGSPKSWSSDSGGCAVFNSDVSNLIYGQETSHTIGNDLHLTDNYSWSVWICPSFVLNGNGANYVFTVARADYNTFGYGLQVASSTELGVWYGNKRYVVPYTENTWTHVVFTVNNRNIKIYINNVLQLDTVFDGADATFEECSSLGIGCFRYSSGNIYPYTGKIKDFRIYNNPLDENEIYNLYYNLILHYPLSNPYESLQHNLYNNPVINGSSLWTITEKEDAQGKYYNCILNYTGTGSTTWASLYFPAVSFEVSKKYQYSCKLRIRTNNAGVEIRSSRIDNDWVTNMINISGTHTEWKEYKVSQTLNQYTYRDDSHNGVLVQHETSPRFEIYTYGMTDLNKVFKIDLDIRDVQIIQTNVDIPYIFNSSNIVSDCSGNSYNGSLTSKVELVESPKYKLGYKFNNNYIKSNLTYTPSEFSVSFWVKPSENEQDKHSIICSSYANNSNEHYGSFWIAINCEDYGVWTFTDKNSKYCKFGDYLEINKWHFCTFTYKNNIGSWYVNGEFLGSSDIGQIIIKNLCVGNSYNGSTWNTSFYGSLSDFRVYSKCLEKNSINILYKNILKINKNIYLNGEIIETD